MLIGKNLTWVWKPFAKILEKVNPIRHGNRYWEVFVPGSSILIAHSKFRTFFFHKLRWNKNVAYANLTFHKWSLYFGCFITKLAIKLFNYLKMWNFIWILSCAVKLDLEREKKNYLHIWTYPFWLLRHAGGWSSSEWVSEARSSSPALQLLLYATWIFTWAGVHFFSTESALSIAVVWSLE